MWEEQLTKPFEPRYPVNPQSGEQGGEGSCGPALVTVTLDAALEAPWIVWSALGLKGAVCPQSKQAIIGEWTTG